MRPALDTRPQGAGAVLLNILAIEPYYGGSHKSFLDGWRGHSRHRVELLTMPARKWKWRMRGAALHVAGLLIEEPPDVVLAGDYLDLAALTGLAPEWLAAVPCAVYFHENQLTYPLSAQDERDYQFAFTNITTCLSAKRVIFNSRYHMDSFLGAVGALLSKMPDFVPEGVPERIRERAAVIPVGVDLAGIDRLREAAGPRRGPLRILWNHRWEFDKAPETFFRVIERLDAAGYEFELAVVGESFRAQPPVFQQARRRLAHRISAFGYVELREDYLRCLIDSDVVVSTAVHEFFGIAVVEALGAGCAPLLPNRLSYPEILPAHLHPAHLYDGEQELFERLRAWAGDPEAARAIDLRGEVARFGWGCVAPQLDAALEALANAPGAHENA